MTAIPFGQVPEPSPRSPVPRRQVSVFHARKGSYRSNIIVAEIPDPSSNKRTSGGGPSEISMGLTVLDRSHEHAHQPEQHWIQRLGAVQCCAESLRADVPIIKHLLSDSIKFLKHLKHRQSTFDAVSPIPAARSWNFHASQTLQGLLVRTFWRWRGHPGPSATRLFGESTHHSLPPP
jgi:hypothetical protein